MQWGLRTQGNLFPSRFPRPITAEQQLSEQIQYGLEGGSVFLECEPRSPHATIKWLMQTDDSTKRKVLPRDRVLLQTPQGVLLGPVMPSDSGLYQCIGTENRFRHTLRRLRLHILPRALLEGAITSEEAPMLGICESYRAQVIQHSQNGHQSHTGPSLWGSEQQSNWYRSAQQHFLNWTTNSPHHSQSSSRRRHHHRHHHHRSKPWAGHQTPPRS